MNTKIMAADRAVSNSNGTNWLPTLQAATQRTRLYTLSYRNLTGSAVYLWLFDTAAGSSASASPVAVRQVAANTDGVWDYEPGGKIFMAGLYIVAATGAPAAVTTTPTAAANDAMILSADIRTL